MNAPRWLIIITVVITASCVFDLALLLNNLEFKIEKTTDQKTHYDQSLKSLDQNIEIFILASHSCLSSPGRDLNEESCVLMQKTFIQFETTIKDISLLIPSMNCRNFKIENFGKEIHKLKNVLEMKLDLLKYFKTNHLKTIGRLELDRTDTLENGTDKLISQFTFDFGTCL